ncbi:MAG: hypothetical protein AAFP17_12005 [Pseudomonadota bacterium]
MITLASYTLEIKGDTVEVGFLHSWFIAAAEAAAEDAAKAGDTEAEADYRIIAEMMAGISPEALLTTDAFQEALAEQADLLKKAGSSLEAMLDLFGSVPEQGLPGRDPLGADPRLADSPVKNGGGEKSSDVDKAWPHGEDFDYQSLRKAAGWSNTLDSDSTAEEAQLMLALPDADAAREAINEKYGPHSEDGYPLDENGEPITDSLPWEEGSTGNGNGDDGGPRVGAVDGSGYEGRDMGAVEGFLVKLMNLIDGKGWTSSTTHTTGGGNKPEGNEPGAGEEADAAPESEPEEARDDSDTTPPDDGFNEEEWSDADEGDGEEEDDKNIKLFDDQTPDQNTEYGGGDPTATDSSDGHTDGASGNGSGTGGTTQPVTGDDEDEPDLILFYDPLTPLVNPGNEPLDDSFIYENLEPVDPHEGTTQPVNGDETPTPDLPPEPIGGGGTYSEDGFIF